MYTFEDIDDLIKNSENERVFIFIGLDKNLIDQHKTEIELIFDTMSKNNKAIVILVDKLHQKHIDQSILNRNNTHIGYIGNIYKNIEKSIGLIIKNNKKDYIYDLINMNQSHKLIISGDKISVKQIKYDIHSLYYKCYKHTDEHELRKRIANGKVNYSYPVKYKISDDDICTKRWMVYSSLENIYGSNIKNPSTKLISDAFDLIDKNFFDGYLSKKIEELGIAMKFEWSNKMTKSAGMLVKKKYKNITLKLSLSIFAGLFPEFERKFLKHNNIHCSDTLSCIIVTIEHEIIHLLSHLSPDIREHEKVGIYSSHGKCFSELAAAIFNHNGSTHHLLSNHDDVTTENDNYKNNFSIGDRVFLMGKDIYGTVIKVNNKTIVAYFDNGKKYKAHKSIVKKSDEGDKKMSDIPKFKKGDRVLYIVNDILGVIDEVNKNTVKVILDNNTTGNVSPALLKLVDNSDTVPIVKNNFVSGQRVEYTGSTGGNVINGTKGIIMKINPVYIVVRLDNDKIYKIHKSKLKVIDNDYPNESRNQISTNNSPIITNSFYTGQKVEFDHKGIKIGTIIKINPKFIKVKLDDDMIYNVLKSHLRPHNIKK